MSEPLQSKRSTKLLGCNPHTYHNTLLPSTLPCLQPGSVFCCKRREYISARTGLPPVVDFIRRRCLSVFGHIARLTQGIPAHNALHCQVGLASGRSLGRDWRRRPGRPHARWTDQLRNNTGSVPANLWREAILWDHGGAMRRPELATRWRWRRRRE